MLSPTFNQVALTFVWFFSFPEGGDPITFPMVSCYKEKILIELTQTIVIAMKERILTESVWISNGLDREKS